MVLYHTREGHEWCALKGFIRGVFLEEVMLKFKEWRVWFGVLKIEELV